MRGGRRDPVAGQRQPQPGGDRDPDRSASSVRSDVDGAATQLGGVASCDPCCRAAAVVGDPDPSGSGKRGEIGR
jgi:hypothetical protein